MAEDKANTASGQERIDISSADSLDTWARKLQVTHDQLREAVRAVGSSAADVELHLKGSRSTTNADQAAKLDE